MGRSGGLLCVWDPTYFIRSGVFKNRRYLIITGNIKATGERVNIFNIYAPNDPGERRFLWNELLEKRWLCSGLCVMVGDFNEVRDATERLNSEFVSSHADAFNRFINEADLGEYHMGGGLFTYVSDHGDKFSKIDRVLVCKDFMRMWPLASLNVLAK